MEDHNDQSVSHVALRTQIREESDDFFVQVSRDDLEHLLCDRDMLRFVCFDYYNRRDTSAD